jgi:hypothetical protein
MSFSSAFGTLPVTCTREEVPQAAAFHGGDGAHTAKEVKARHDSRGLRDGRTAGGLVGTLPSAGDLNFHHGATGTFSS